MRAPRIILLLILLLFLFACLASVTPGLRCLSFWDREVPAASEERQDFVLRLLPVIAFFYFLLAAFFPRLRLPLPSTPPSGSRPSGPGIGVVRTRGRWHWYEIVSRSKRQPANFFHCYGAAIICAGMAFEAWFGNAEWATHMPSNLGIKLGGVGLIFLFLGSFERRSGARYRVVWLPQRWWGRKRHPSLSEAASRRHNPEKAKTGGGQMPGGR